MYTVQASIRFFYFHMLCMVQSLWRTNNKKTNILIFHNCEHISCKGNSLLFIQFLQSGMALPWFAVPVLHWFRLMPLYHIAFYVLKNKSNIIYIWPQTAETMLNYNNNKKTISLVISLVQHVHFKGHEAPVRKPMRW